MTGTEVDMRMRPHVQRPYGYTADGPWEMRKRTREVARAGFDLVKMFTSGPRVPGEQESDVWYVNQTAEEVEAAVSEAHTLGMRVMVHATTEEAIRLAVEAGVDTIEHGWPLADDVIESMRERGTILVPTISVYSERGFLRDEVQRPLYERASNQLPIRADSVRRAFEAGVRIACGTDITPSMPTMRHGENAFELQALVRAGVESIDAIRAATGIAADALGVLDQLGTVSEGKLADAVLVSRDPEADISALEHAVELVLKDGAVVVFALIPAPSLQRPGSRRIVGRWRPRKPERRIPSTRSRAPSRTSSTRRARSTATTSCGATRRSTRSLGTGPSRRSTTSR